MVGASSEGAFMIVKGTKLADELRRRRLGRPELRDCLSRTSESAWVPGAQINEAPNELLMLAALSLADAVASPLRVQPVSPLTRGAPPDTSAFG
jgi:hypothetical protein